MNNEAASKVYSQDETKDIDLAKEMFIFFDSRCFRIVILLCIF